jgi:hypothetical protein
MPSFLITFKPSSENPARGWPLKNLQHLARGLQNGEVAQEKWRFSNRKDVKNGDRVFLLLQGKQGPAIIGYGRIDGTPEIDRGKRVIPIKFENLVDPLTKVLTAKGELTAIDEGKRLWRTQSSGVAIPDNVAAKLEALVVGKPPKSAARETSNPDWTRDELIVALNVYLKQRPDPPGKDSKEIVDLSRSLNAFGEKLFPPEERGNTFRNENGVYMKLMNFRRLDPEYTKGGRTGLARGAKAEEDVWTEFAADPLHCQEVAEAIGASLNDPEVKEAWAKPDLFPVRTNGTN